MGRISKVSHPRDEAMRYNIQVFLVFYIDINQHSEDVINIFITGDQIETIC